MHVHLACTQVATLMETTSAAEEAEVRPTPTPGPAPLTLTLALTPAPTPTFALALTCTSPRSAGRWGLLYPCCICLYTSRLALACEVGLKTALGRSPWPGFWRRENQALWPEPNPTPSMVSPLRVGEGSRGGRRNRPGTGDTLGDANHRPPPRPHLARLPYP